TANPSSQQMLIEITAVIEAVLRLDNDNMKRLKAELTEISNSLLKLKEGRTVLGQYKPARERLPQFVNRKV
ncbi:MAG: hypothetical protein O7G88_17685, partial [bacterium]|nr:hypothetical protein [bacterium]